MTDWDLPIGHCNYLIYWLISYAAKSIFVFVKTFVEDVKHLTTKLLCEIF